MLVLEDALYPATYNTSSHHAVFTSFQLPRCLQFVYMYFKFREKGEIIKNEINVCIMDLKKYFLDFYPR